MLAREQRMLLAGAAGTAALLLLTTLAGHAEVLAYAAPVLILALPLVAGRYVGEERLRRLGSLVARRPRRPAASRPATRRSAVLAPRGGRLIAHGLAERGPPLLATS
jgi:hypothetical protein